MCVHVSGGSLGHDPTLVVDRALAETVGDRVRALSNNNNNNNAAGRFYMCEI